MKIVLNKRFGGFDVTKEWATKHGYPNTWNIERDDADLITAIENGENINGFYAKLVVVEIPDEATDWEINEYDGMESITAVVDGKLAHF